MGLLLVEDRGFQLGAALELLLPLAWLRSIKRLRSKVLRWEVTLDYTSDSSTLLKLHAALMTVKLEL